MEEKFDILDQLVKRPKPQVPEGYFEQFPSAIVSKLNESEVSDAIQKETTKPAVPEGFFENFSDELMAKITEQETGIDRLKKTAKPTVPAGYFENFAASIETEEKVNKPSSTRIFTLRTVGVVASIAACLLVMFSILPINEENVAEETNVETEEVNLAETVTDDEYYAFLDGNDVVDFILENEDIEIEEETSEEEEDVFYFLEEDIEDFYYDEL